MLSPDIQFQIVEAGSLAPSGDNLQPWLVEWQGDVLHVAVDPGRDRSLYNFRRRASLIAIGAMVENMMIAAREHGLDTRLALVPQADDLVAARLSFEARPIAADPLYPFIATRCTNRKPYAGTPLAEGVLDTLRQALPADGRSELHLVEDPERMRAVARAASLNDRLLLEIRPLHDDLFASVRWTTAEAERSRDGLFVKTLELGAMSMGFRAMRSWRVARLLGRSGGTLMAPRHSFQTFMRSAAFGFLQMSDTSPEAFLEGGRRIERIWLQAASLGLAFQPMAGMLYLLNYLRSPHGLAVVGGSVGTIRRAEALFGEAWPTDPRKAAIMVFRIGYAPPPTATSLRRVIVSRPT